MTKGRTSRGNRVLAFFVVAGGLSSALVADSLVVRHDKESVQLWSGADSVVEFSLSGSTVETAVEAEGAQILAARTDENDLAFYRVEQGRTERLADLPRPSRKLRAGPVLLAADERLEGVAWLEGTWQQDLTVRAATWNGTSWETNELVSGRMSGPQVALSGTVLGDGSWLLVWAGFDGTDDEIYWSRRVDGVWSTPKRLHAGNKVPDITPVVSVAGDSAVVAWSVFDGNDYRIRTARWQDQRWQVGSMLHGKGGLQADWERQDDRSFLVYRTIVPEAWHVVEYGQGGQRTGKSSVASEAPDRPVLAVREGALPRMRWPWTGPGRERPNR